jgi:multicomponent K+:H+ antiporter subunit E
MIRSFARSISPLLVLGLATLWLLLNQTLAPGQIALGLVLGTGLSWAGSTLRPLHARIRRADLAVSLLLLVLVDILRSNVGVARVVLGLTGRRGINASFVDIPLELKDPHGLAVLAMIVTSTPGTVWVGVTPDGATLRLHVLDLVDAQYWINLIKHRYERRLLRIFA